nr:MAG TPA: hypothetical protein [Caudoviricetes sp.]
MKNCVTRKNKILVSPDTITPASAGFFVSVIDYFTIFW